MTKTVFIHGLQKTSTSPMVALLNSHPDVCVLYETNLFETRVSKYGNHLLAGIPSARKFFFNTDTTAKPYQLLARHIQKEVGEKFAYFGDKLLSFDARLSQPEKNKVIYMMRDVRSWLVKDLIRDLYRTDIDCVSPSIEYLKYIMHAKTCQSAMCVRLEDLIENQDRVVKDISAFLNVNLNQESWITDAAKEAKSGVKSFQKWQKAHPTSSVPFRKHDVKIELKEHAFWEAYLPLFDKYYHLSDPGVVSASQLKGDLKLVDDMARFCCTPIEALYENVTQIRLIKIPTKKMIKIKLKKFLSKIKRKA